MKKNNDDNVMRVDDITEAQAVSNSIVRHFTKQYLSCPIEVLEKCSPQACICYMKLLYRSNVSDVVTNGLLAKDLNCTKRTVSNLIEELTAKGCIKVLYVSKTIRFIYPVYVLPVVFKVTSKIEDMQELEDENGGFTEL